MALLILGSIYGLGVLVYTLGFCAHSHGMHPIVAFLTSLFSALMWPIWVVAGILGR